MDKTRMQQYMSQMRAMFNKHALYSDEPAVSDSV